MYLLTVIQQSIISSPLSTPLITIISVLAWFVFPYASLYGGLVKRFFMTHIKFTSNHNNPAAFGQATIAIPASNLSIPLGGGSIGNLTAQNATNATAGQQIIQSQQQQQQQQSQQNQSTNQTNANAQNQQTHQSVNLRTYFVLYRTQSDTSQ